MKFLRESEWCFNGGHYWGESGLCSLDITTKCRHERVFDIAENAGSVWEGQFTHMLKTFLSMYTKDWGRSGESSSLVHRDGGLFAKTDNYKTQGLHKDTINGISLSFKEEWYITENYYGWEVKKVYNKILKFKTY